MKRRSIRSNIRARVEDNRQRVADACEQEEHEAEAIRQLNQSKPEDVIPRPKSQDHSTRGCVSAQKENHLHPRAAKHVRRGQQKRVAANRRKYYAARNDNGVSRLELEAIRQMKAERQQERKPVITI